MFIAYSSGGRQEEPSGSPSMTATQAEPKSSTWRQPLVRSGGEQQPRPRSGEGEQQRPSSSHVAALRSCLHPTRAAATWRQASTHGENPLRPKICWFFGPIWIYMGSWCWLTEIDMASGFPLTSTLTEFSTRRSLLCHWFCTTGVNIENYMNWCTLWSGNMLLIVWIFAASELFYS